MFRTTKLCAGLMLAFGGSAVLLALPAAAQQAQRVEITGSAIKRVNAEGPAPVEVYTRKEIERTGATTISELVKNIAALDIDDQGELTANSPSGSGTQQLQIRGLSERNLLVLLNGRRLPINALTDGSGAGAAVDVNNIPISAIDRVEILKDGGSAIYGADAVAGVINFITRRNYTGLEAKLGFGSSTRGDAKETSGNVIFGMGDYDATGFNVLAALDVFKRDPLMRSDRAITASADWRSFDGGVDGRSGFHPNGNILNAAGTRVVGQVIPCPPGDLSGVTCRFDFNKSVLTSINGADRWSSMLIGNLKLGGMRAFGEVVYSESKDLFEAQPAPGFFTDAQGRGVNGRFMQVGPRTTNRKSSLFSGTIGLEGTLANWDFDVALGHGVGKVSNNDSNYLDATKFQAALDAGTIDPTSNSNPTALLNSLKITPNRNGKSTITFLNFKASGALAELPGGPLMMAAGVNLNSEKLTDRPDADQRAGNVFGSIQQASVDAKRDLRAIFAELSLPIFKGLEAQVAVRHDSYSKVQGKVEATVNGVTTVVDTTGDSASRTSPKVALKYRPSETFMVRGSYAQSFLAPSLKQMFGGLDEGAESTSDTDILCPAFGVPDEDCDNFPYRNVSGSNPFLKPETGKTYNLGFVFEPINLVSVGVDFWKIAKRNEASTPTVESAVEGGAFARVNGQWVVFTNLQNFAQTESSGLDMDVRLRLGDTPLGRLVLRNSVTYYQSSKNRSVGGDWNEYVGTFLNPRWRNTLSANLEKGPWATTVTVRSTAAMRDTQSAFGTAAHAAARKVNAHEQLDIGVTYTGIPNLTLAGAVKNLFDRMPPFSQRGTLNQNGSLGFPWIYSPRGRFIQFSASYRFF